MKYIVYLIKSIEEPNIVYVGFTTNLAQRLATHNEGKSIHTSKFGSWELVMYMVFKDKIKALNFEKYLKSHAGRAFCAKRFL